MNDSAGVHLQGGMSAEVCFAKFLAQRHGKVYTGWTNQIVDIGRNTIVDTLNYITALVRDVARDGDMVMMAPGFLSVPYIVDYANMLYLPTQFLVAVPNVKDLVASIDYAKSQGLNPYAVIGYDQVIPHRMLAWIKFRTVPKQYIQLLRRLSVKDTFLMGVWNPLGKVEGEAVNRTYLGSSDIYFTFVNESYGRPELDWQILERFYGPSFRSQIAPDTVTEVGDWESSVDSMTKYVDPDLVGSGGCTQRLHLCYASVTTDLYLLTPEVAKVYMHQNGISRKGTVLNPYMISNPMYEIAYGYLPVTYWQMNKRNPMIYSDYIQPDELGEVWVNLVNAESRCNLLDTHPIRPATILTEGQVPEFIARYHPTDLWTRKWTYLNVYDILLILKGMDITVLSV